MIEIVFYEKENGERPAQIFLDSLDLKMQAKMMRTILLLAQNGSALREPYSKYLRNGIFELRAKVGNNITRVLYYYVVSGKVVLTHGYIKKEDKTPSSEIERAIKYRRDYEKRIEGK